MSLTVYSKAQCRFSEHKSDFIKFHKYLLKFYHLADTVLGSVIYKFWMELPSVMERAIYTNKININSALLKID